MRTMKVFVVIIGLALLGGSTSLAAQYVSVRGLGFLGLAHSQGAEYFYNGGGFELSYQHSLEKARLSGGLEYRIINWGHQVALQLGYDYPYWQQGSWRASAFAHGQVGSALYVQRGLFVWGAELGTALEWKSKKAFFATLALGGRFSHCPAYGEYGLINTTFDIPIKLGIGFKLGNRK